MWYTGDEHDETGHISEEPSNRNMMMEKRMKKLETAHIEIPLEEKLSLFGQKGAENVVVSWGSPKGAILEAMRMLQTEGFDIEFMQARMINPLPTERIEESLNRARTKITVEMNYSGQLANIVTEKTGVFMDYYILKYNGRPMTTTELHKALREAIRGEAPKRQVLNFGA